MTLRNSRAFSKESGKGVIKGKGIIAGTIGYGIQRFRTVAILS